ncbi:MAG TPA: hypothetical protein VGB62_10340 [Allosphingosinicella sp.]|jgi:uncharacterized repeat protein (TIGR01451 family)
MKMLIALFALLAPVAASAADNVALTSQVLVERTKAGPDGKPVTTREAPGVVTPGDKLVFQLGYTNKGAEPATGFTLTNPIPESVAYTGAESDGATVSVDGGKSWGALAALKVAQADGTSRAAAPSDVTHVRWSFASAIPAGASGSVSFRGVVK